MCLRLSSAVMRRVARWIPTISAGWVGGVGRVGVLGAVVLLLIAVPCFVTLPWAAGRYDRMSLGEVGEVGVVKRPPSLVEPMGTDGLGRSLLWRCLLGGAVSLTVGIGAATLAVTLGVAWGATAGYLGGRTDAIMMRAVDVLYGLPYILLVVLIDLALSDSLVNLAARVMPGGGGGGAGRGAMVAGEMVTLLLAIGAVSWLTMARVIRGQVLSLRAQPFVEAARALGVGPLRVMRVHLLPNLLGPIVVYTTLTVPAAILQESFLSFLGIGVQPPLPSWGNLAAEGVRELPALASRSGRMSWWLVVFPCVLLGLTLLSLNFVGDGLRGRFERR